MDSKKAKKQEFRRKVAEMINRKNRELVFQEVAVCSDKLLVKLRDAMAGTCDLEQAIMTENYRQARIVASKLNSK